LRNFDGQKVSESMQKAFDAEYQAQMVGAVKAIGPGIFMD